MRNKRLYTFLGLCFLLVSSTMSIAGDKTTSFPSEPKVARVGGVYFVKSLDRQEDGTFIVMFESETATGKYDLLKLESEHVHIGVQPGQKLRLSAEILSSQGNTSEVAQVLLFIPGAGGPTPIWMLSKKNASRDLNGARYLEMHAPQSDFRVF